MESPLLTPSPKPAAHPFPIFYVDIILEGLRPYHGCCIEPDILSPFIFYLLSDISNPRLFDNLFLQYVFIRNTFLYVSVTTWLCWLNKIFLDFAPFQTYLGTL